jgi:hypothetical protein
VKRARRVWGTEAAFVAALAVVVVLLALLGVAPATAVPGAAELVGEAASPQGVSAAAMQPAVVALSPSQCAAGVPAFAITVVGSGFVPGALVLWNGEARDTAFISTAVLVATVRDGDVAEPGVGYVSVLNPGVDGGHSPTALGFNILSPAPAVDSISPESVWAGGGSFELTVDGHGFAPSSTVQIAGVDAQTHFVSQQRLTALVSQQVVRYAASVSVRVYTPEPGGGLSSLLFLEVADDDVPPVTAVSGLPSLWNRTAVTLTLVATDTGRGVERTFYRVGEEGEYSVGTTVRIPAPSNHSNDGLHVVQFFSIDQVLNWEQPIKEIDVGIDTTPPTTSVSALVVKAGGKFSPRYYVYDALSPRARDAVLQIVDGRGVVKQRCVLGKPTTRTWHSAGGFTVKVPRGSYKMRVLAHDLAGNAQSSTRSAVLTVK